MTGSTAFGNLSGNRLSCVAIPDEKHDDVLEHLRQSFFYDEPLNHAIGLCKRGESHVELEKHCHHTLAQNYSCMIVDENDKVVGASLNAVIKKGEREEAERRLAELKDEKFKKIFGLLYKINENVDLFSKYGVDELFECRILSVDPNYRGKGLANLLIEASIETAKNAGFKVFKADATGIYSQSIFRKYGFQIVTEILYSEVEERLRPGPPHEALKLMTKVLE